MPLQDVPMPQLALAIGLASAVLLIVLELVRRRKLREEYAILWICTAVVLLVLALETRVLAWLQDLVEAESPLSILFFGALVFLLLVALQFSVRLTKLSFRSKVLSQQVALMQQQLDEISRRLEELGGEEKEPAKRNAEEKASR